MRRIHFAATAAVATLLLACDITEPCACPPTVWMAAMEGTVRGPAGEPVGGGWIASLYGPSACLPYADSTVVRPDGTYLRQVVAHGPPSDGQCVKVWAEPPAGSALRASDTVTVDPARFGENSPRETVRADFTLRAP